MKSEKQESTSIFGNTAELATQPITFFLIAYGIMETLMQKESEIPLNIFKQRLGDTKLNINSDILLNVNNKYFNPDAREMIQQLINHIEKEENNISRLRVLNQLINSNSKYIYALVVLVKSVLAHTADISNNKDYSKRVIKSSYTTITPDDLQYLVNSFRIQLRVIIAKKNELEYQIKQPVMGKSAIYKRGITLLVIGEYYYLLYKKSLFNSSNINPENMNTSNSLPEYLRNNLYKSKISLIQEYSGTKTPKANIKEQQKIKELEDIIQSIGPYSRTLTEGMGKFLGIFEKYADQSMPISRYELAGVFQGITEGLKLDTEYLDQKGNINSTQMKEHFERMNNINFMEKIEKTSIGFEKKLEENKQAISIYIIYIYIYIYRN